MSFDTLLMQAAWTMAPKEFASPVIIRKFRVKSCARADLAIATLGLNRGYINGKRICNEVFLPLHSIYHSIDFDSLEYPIHDEFTFRAYYSVFNVTDLLRDGENTLEIHLGNGFYRQSERTAEGDWCYGDSLGAKYALKLFDGVNEHIIFSDCTETARDSAIRYSELFVGEIYDARVSKYESYTYSPTVEKHLPDTILTIADAPADTVECEALPTLIYSDGERKLYDVGTNISGYARIKAFAEEGERVSVRYAEELCGNELDFITTGSDYSCRSGRKQIMEDVFIGDGAEHIYEPTFVWHAFRYFEVVGKAEALSVSVIHTHAPVTSTFSSSSPELNWLYNAFIRTQLNNMHLGFPSDCPHRERLGYTGDGQIASFATMNLIESKDFYRKWIRDIFDSQDKNGGHVSHTAPFAGGGGGPVGWGGAAVIVPYNYYKVFGDKAPLYENYEGMKRYVAYVLSRSDGGLVTREEEGGWVLGDWCTLHECKIPVPFVNTALFIKCLTYLEEIALAIGKSCDVTEFARIRENVSHALREKYLDTSSGRFAEGIQGADAYAIYASVEDSGTLGSLVKKYDSLGYFDTGFIGTYILLDVLFKNGAENTAYGLLTSHEPGSFGYMMDNGATTVWEHWRGEGSHDHPMFGASAIHLFTGILGVEQKEGTYGYDSVVIAPNIPDALEYANGSITTVNGEICVGFKRNGTVIEFNIKVPDNVNAEFRFRGMSRKLTKIESNIIYEG